MITLEAYRSAMIDQLGRRALRSNGLERNLRQQRIEEFRRGHHGLARALTLLKS